MSKFNWAFTETALASYVNVPHLVFNYLSGRDDIFETSPMNSPFVEIGTGEDGIRLLPAQGPGTRNFRKEEKQKGHVLKMPYFTSDAIITPDDLDAIKRYMQRQAAPESLPQALLRKLDRCRMDHSITEEYMRMQAIKGVLTDGDGDVIYDYYTEFGKTKKTIDLVLGTDTTDIIEKLDEMKEHQRNETGTAYTRHEVLMESTLFNRLTQHPKVEKYYQNWQAATSYTDPVVSQTRGGGGANIDKMFNFNGVYFGVYSAFAKKTDGTTVRFIDAGKGHALTDAPAQFEDAYGPPYTVEGVNQVPDEKIHVSQDVLPHGQGVDIHTQKRQLIITKKPGACVELFTSN